MPTVTSADSNAGTAGGQASAKRRMRLWEVQGGLQCSIIGTCFSHDDLIEMTNKAGFRIPMEATAYDVHGFCVNQAGTPCRLARLMHKRLEQRYSGVITKVSRCKSVVELAALWETEQEAGRIAGAYWAFLSHGHVPKELGNRIFGEVHMLSHVLGRVTRQSLQQASTLQSQVDDLQARLARQGERHRILARERDDARDLVARLSSQTVQSAISAASDGRATIVPGPVIERRETRRKRALIASRERARAAEAQVERLEAMVAQLRKSRLLRPSSEPTECAGAVACDAAVASDIARRVLYIGGRTGGLDQLRRIAARTQGEFFHHDGGEHESVSRIDGLIEHCDVVFCPVDCVSHSACLRAKSLCKRLKKPFVPLHSSGGTSFERALADLTRRQ